MNKEYCHKGYRAKWANQAFKIDEIPADLFYIYWWAMAASVLHLYELKALNTFSTSTKYFKKTKRSD